MPSWVTAVKVYLGIHLGRCREFSSPVSVRKMNAFYEEITNICLLSQGPKELMAAGTKCFKMLKNGFWKSCFEPEKMWESKKRNIESHNGLVLK